MRFMNAISRRLQTRPAPFSSDANRWRWPCWNTRLSCAVWPMRPICHNFVRFSSTFTPYDDPYPYAGSITHRGPSRACAEEFIGLASCLGYLDHLLTKMATWVMEAEAHFICGARGSTVRPAFSAGGRIRVPSASVWSALRSAFRAYGMYEPERSVLCKRTAFCASVGLWTGKA